MGMNNSKAFDIFTSKATEAKKEAALQALLRKACGERECPDCGEVAMHKDNGGHGLDRAWCCVRCGSHFDEVSYV